MECVLGYLQGEGGLRTRRSNQSSKVCLGGRRGGRYLLVGFAHLVDLGDVHPVDHVDLSVASVSQGVYKFTEFKILTFAGGRR